MTSTDHLALLDLSGNRDPATTTNLREALLRYGAFRLRAPELKKAYCPKLRRNVSIYYPSLPYILIDQNHLGC
jgi:hypothetical protein